MPTFKIQHLTRYEYDRAVKESVNEIKIYPYQSDEQEVLQHDLFITGHPDVQVFFDYWGNKTGSFNLLPNHLELTIESKLVVRTTAGGELKINFDTGFDELQQEMKGHMEMLETAAADKIGSQAEINDIIRTELYNQKSIAAIAETCCTYIFNHFKYLKGITNIETTVDEILMHRTGVCQDFAHVMLQILRTMNIPCRYVSGYICPNKNGMRGEGATHAWVEVWIPKHGWAGLDPTNNVWVTNTHVKLAVGRNFSDCTPVKGTFKGPAEQQLSVSVSIGYENGNMFEDVNNVRMHSHETVPPQPLMESAQQQ